MKTLLQRKIEAVALMYTKVVHGPQRNVEIVGQSSLWDAG